MTTPLKKTARTSFSANVQQFECLEALCGQWYTMGAVYSLADRAGSSHRDVGDTKIDLQVCVIRRYFLGIISSVNMF